MYKHLPKSFQIELALIAICRQTLILLVGVCLGLMLWRWMAALEISQIIYTAWEGLLLGMGIRIEMVAAAILLLLVFIVDVIFNSTHFKAFFSPTIAGEYPLSYRFNWPAILLYVILLCVIVKRSPVWASCAVLFLDGITLFLLFKGREDKTQVSTKSREDDSPNKDENPLKDTPISNLKEDSLGREGFVDTFYHIIDDSHNNRNVILLNGSWGQGKTSILNCVESYAAEQAKNQLIFRWVNPWQNDTKERFVAALLEEINLFLQYTPPVDSISRSLLKRLSFSVQPFPWININFPSASSTHNIEVNIRELSDKLKQKQNRLVIIVDDLDRLNKQQILDMLASVYLFSECHNIIFVLAANQTKVESLLTESQSNEKTGETHSYYNAYQGYLEKIATNIVPLPDILPEKLRDCLITQIEDPRNKISFTAEEKEHIPATLFHNLRDVKRVLQEFSNVMKQNCVQGEVNHYHMLLVTYLHVFAPKVYINISQNSSFWIKEELEEKRGKRPEGDDTLLMYFNQFFLWYPDQKEELKKIFLLLNPEYQKILIQSQKITFEDALYKGSSLLNSFMSHHVSKPFYNKDYFYRYFTYRPDTYTISDKQMLRHLEKLSSQSQQEAAHKVRLFLTRCKVSQIDSYFSYLHNNVPFKGHERLYNVIAKGLILLLNDGTVQMATKQLIIQKHIPQWVAQKEISNKILLHIFNQVSSILFKQYIYLNSRSQNIALLKQLTLPPANNYTAEDILKEEDKYRDFSLSSSLLYSWMREWKDSSEYDNKKKNQVLKIFIQNEHYFWLAVGKELYESIDNHASNILIEKTKPWGITTIQQIISSLLKMPHLSHKTELLTLQKVLKGLSPIK